jgi:hypothetical protein
MCLLRFCNLRLLSEDSGLQQEVLVMLLLQAVCTVDLLPTTSEIFEVLKRALKSIYTHILPYNYHEFHFVFLPHFRNI